MKKASIAVALVLVFGLFAAAFSLTPAIAQYGTSPGSTSSTGNATSTTGNTSSSGNTTTSSTNTTSSNATSTGGSTFSARGSIATLIFDTGTTTTNNTNETGTSSTNTTSMSNTTSTGNTSSSGNTISSGNTTMGQTMIGGDNSTSTTGNTTGMMGSNTTTSSTGNATSSGSTTSSDNATSTASLDLPFIVSGDWSLDVQNGSVSNFKANMTMVHVDGTARHTHEVSNFQAANGSMVQLEQNGTTVIFGTADVSSNGSPKWTGVNTVITIENLNVASVSFASEQTEDHFHGQPIYGIVDSLTDENGNEMIQTGSSTQTAGNSTDGNMTNTITQGAQNAANTTGNALSNVTEGIKDFFNGTG